MQCHAYFLRILYVCHWHTDELHSVESDFRHLYSLLISLIRGSVALPLSGWLLCGHLFPRSLAMERHGKPVFAVRL